MGRALKVEINNRELIPFINLNAAGIKELHLTPIKDNQQEAHIKIFLVDQYNKKLFHQLIIKPLPYKEAKKNIIYLKGQFDGFRSLSVDIKLNNTSYLQRTYKLPWKPPTWIFWLAGGSLGAALLIWALMTIVPTIPSREKVGQPTSPARAVNEPTREEAAKQAQEEAQAEEEAARLAEEEAQAEEEAARLAEEEAQAEEEAARQALIARYDILIEKKVIYFLPNDWTLLPGQIAKLKELLPLLQETDKQVTFLGHTAIAGSEAGRIEVSENRAKVVRDFLEDLGWNPKREPVILPKGMADPVTRGKNQDANRRVEIRLVD